MFDTPRKSDRKVVLIHPGMVTDDYSYVPFESIFLGRFLERNGYRVEIIDQRVDRDWEARFNAVRSDALFVGLTVITGPQIGFALKASERLRQLAPDLPIVWGGWHVTFVPESAIGHPLVDYVICGIGELKILQFCHWLEGGRKGRLDIEGILYEGGRTDYTPQKERYEDLPAMPAYHLIDLEKYRSPRNVCGVITSRGCPFRCGFCTIAQISFLTRPKDSVADEVSYLVGDKGFEEIMFADGLFFAQRSRVLQLMDEIEDRGLKFKWKCSIRPETLRRWSDAEMQRLIDNGLYFLFTGVESGSETMLGRIQKDADVDDVYYTAERSGQLGLGLTMSFMSGLPHETVDDLKASEAAIRRIIELNPRAVLLNPIYQPVPGAPTYDEMIRLGWKAPETLDEWEERIDYNLTIDDIDPFPWMSRAEFDEYKAVYKDSILFDRRLVDVYTKQ